MPSARRFALLRDTVRNHPVIVASSAASVGVLLGAFVAVQLLATPQPRVDSAAALQMALAPKGEAKPVPETKPVSETTGSAPTSDRTASVDCERETWPYLSRRCMDEMQSRYRTRVISTDKLDQSTIAAIEASSPAPQPPVESKPAAADTASVSPSPSPVDLVAGPLGSVCRPGCVAAAVTSAAPPAVATCGQCRGKEGKQRRGKKRKSASRRNPSGSPKPNSSLRRSRSSMTTMIRPSPAADSDERVDRRLERADRRPDRRRIVGRSTEQDYDVPASNGDGQRRITVIRRSGGGLFEGLFGD